MSSYEYDEACIQAFLEQQLKLFPEEVAETPEEAEAFLEDCMAMVCDNKDDTLQMQASLPAAAPIHSTSNTWKMRWIS